MSINKAFVLELELKILVILLSKKVQEEFVSKSHTANTLNRHESQSWSKHLRFHTPFHI